MKAKGAWGAASGSVLSPPPPLPVSTPSPPTHQPQAEQDEGTWESQCRRSAERLPALPAALLGPHCTAYTWPYLGKFCKLSTHVHTRHSDVTRSPSPQTCSAGPQTQAPGVGEAAAPAV